MKCIWKSRLRKWVYRVRIGFASPSRSSDTYASINQAMIGSDNGLLPGRRQAIFCINAVPLSIGITFSELM